MSNFFVQELVLYRHFMLIDSPIPFELVANPTNLQKDERGNITNPDKSLITGRDICSRPAGAWRVDCWTLLPEKYHKLNPVFTMLIKYDMDLLHEGEVVDVRYSDIDIGEGVAGVNGQLVNISPSDFIPIINAMNDTTSEIVGAVNDSGVEIVGAVNSVVAAQNSSNTLLEAVKDAVLEVNNGSVNNKLEQIRTVLKSNISAPSPFYDIKHSQDMNFQTLERYLSNFPRRVYKYVYSGVSSFAQISGGTYIAKGRIVCTQSNNIFTACGEFVFEFSGSSPAAFIKKAHMNESGRGYEVFEPLIIFSTGYCEYGTTLGYRSVTFDDVKFWGIVYKDE